MEAHQEKNNVGAWLSVPQFGDWDQKGGTIPNYSMDFSKIREMRKQNKREVSRASIGNEDELISSSSSATAVGGSSLKTDRHYNQNGSPTTRRSSILSYFNCCVKA
ncbi:unnamed protein product [Cuscuta campestris]|uniref:RIN4 pathogenic type III effector avirulence factor Avr cleavage site domain-containing protein n=1 Tax=Cuscuta campestris TaxID=132261 RepID=A0A484LLI2_9ASTE|nr:unnamed protein product [Cuscuta campestris]